LKQLTWSNYTIVSHFISNINSIVSYISGNIEYSLFHTDIVVDYYE
uniref:Reverse transcriptase domain-containing protein n=1 Tax=Schistosoma curassoni TaxID=6186 RepID=A0A183KK10_9TREM